jgi:hypothetical protein
MFARRAMREEREKQELADLRTTAAPVKLGMLRGQSRRLSLRTAASELVERLGGEIRVEDGSLVMLAPPFSTLSGRDVRATRTNRRGSPSPRRRCRPMHPPDSLARWERHEEPATWMSAPRSKC